MTVYLLKMIYRISCEISVGIIGKCRNRSGFDRSVLLFCCKISKCLKDKQKIVENDKYIVEKRIFMKKELLYNAFYKVQEITKSAFEEQDFEY